MDAPYRTLQLTKDRKLHVWQDHDADSPRSWDNLGTMYCFHKRYLLGDNHAVEPNDFSSFDDMKSVLWSEEDLVFPLYLYDHSGLLVSMTPFSDPWDSGQIGFITATKQDVMKEFGAWNQDTIAKARKTLEMEVEVYNEYLRGHVFGFVVEGPNGEEEDSCWGFYGSNIFANGMIEHLPLPDRRVLKRYKKEYL